MEKMRATVFRGVNDIAIEKVPRPHAGNGEAVVRVTLTTICGTDLHIVRGDVSAMRSLFSRRGQVACVQPPVPS